MRLHLGPPPQDPAFDLRPPWRPLREPRKITLVILLALPLGFLAAALFAFAALLLSTGDELVVTLDTASLLALVLLIPVHELMHALVVPGSLASAHLVLGFWPRSLLPYVHYEQELARSRFLLVTLAPLVVLSVLSLVLLRLFPALESFWLVFGLANALGSGGDLLAAGLVLVQVPRRAQLRNCGWLTYWRPPA